MDDDPTVPNADSSLVDALRPAIASIAKLTEIQIQAAITPLVAQITGLEVMVAEQTARLAELEAQITTLTDESKP
jgi:hypothetical protein